MKLNTEVLDSLIKNNGITESFFNYILTEKDLPNTLYKSCYTGYPFGEWHRTARMIEKISKQYKFFMEKNIEDLEFNIFNLLYFFPEYSLSNFEKISNEILELNVNELKIVLEDNRISEKLFYFTKSRDIMSKLDIIKLFFILLSTTFHKNISALQELEYINNLLSLDVRQPFRYALNERKSNMINIRETQKEWNKNSRVALIISGQFRNSKISVDSLLKFFPSSNITEVFISTWDNIATYSFVSEQRFLKYLSEDLLTLYRNGKLDLVDLMERLNNTDFVHCKLKEDSFKSNARVNIKIHKEDSEVYSYMTNPEKMYFNNQYWINRKGFKYFRDNFDYIIKIRPDISLDPIKLDFNYLHNTVLAEEGWIFRRWGFGMGDQIIIGETDVMLNLLNCYCDSKIVELVQNLYHGNFYQGHVNLGILAWISAVYVKRIPDLKHRLVYPEKINYKKLLEMGVFSSEKNCN